LDPSLASYLSLLPRLSRDNALVAAVACKLCGSPALFFDVVDFNKSTGGYAFGPSGINVPWHRCDVCGFLFTPFFDNWSPEHFAQFIYNEDYVLVDPDYLSARPKGMAVHIARLLCGFEGVRILDYGSGTNLLGQDLREFGFAHVESYDPFSSPTRPPGPFDLITCVEVIEHSPSPLAILADMRSFLVEDGCILIGESLQPADIDHIRCGWWYVAPRNGHVSTFAARTFATLAERTGLIFHRGAGHRHMLRAGERFAELAARFGPSLAYFRVGAPGFWPAKGFSGVEGAPGRQFQWTADVEIVWTVDVPQNHPRVQIMVPFLHESRNGFAGNCVVEVNGKALTTTVQDRSIFAETEPLGAGKALIVLRTGSLTATLGRSIGLAIRVVRPLAGVRG
jgi:hypothetical protein